MVEVVAMVLERPVATLRGPAGVGWPGWASPGKESYVSLWASLLVSVAPARN